MGRWEIREVLCCYTAVLRQQALDQYRLEMLVYAGLVQCSTKANPVQAPKLPEILRD